MNNLINRLTVQIKVEVMETERNKLLRKKNCDGFLMSKILNTQIKHTSKKQYSPCYKQKTVLTLPLSATARLTGSKEELVKGSCCLLKHF